MVDKKGKIIVVGSEGGVYLDSDCFTSIEHAFKLWDYFADGVQKHVDSFNRRIDEIEGKQKQEQAKKWYQIF